jgi:hypothetical protein
MGARWYDPSAGQFNNADTAVNSPTPTSVNANRYAYADDSPLDGTDPTGHEDIAPGEGGGGMAEGAAPGVGGAGDDGGGGGYGDDGSQGDSDNSRSSDSDDDGDASPDASEDEREEQEELAEERARSSESQDDESGNRGGVSSDEGSSPGGGDGSSEGDGDDSNSQRAAEQRAAEQRAAEQRAAEQRAAEQRAAEQRATDERDAKANKDVGKSAVEKGATGTVGDEGKSVAAAMEVAATPDVTANVAGEEASEAAGVEGDTSAPEDTGPSITDMLQGHVDQAVSDYESGRIGMSDAQAAAAEEESWLKPMYRGSVIDSAAKQGVLEDPALNQRVFVTPNFVWGADFFTENGDWWDMTTKGQWAAHVNQYDDFYGGLGVRLPTEP